MMKRYNLYTLIHKAIRAQMCQTLTLLGQVNDTSADSINLVLQQLTDLLQFCHGHLQHENDFVHSALINAGHMQPLQTAEDHLLHVQEIEALQHSIQAVSAASGPVTEQLNKLYQQLSLFIAENFNHMLVEETANMALLWQYYAEEDIIAIEHAIVQSIPPLQRMQTTIMMLKYINQSERLLMLGALKCQLPAEAFLLVMASLKTELLPADWQQLDSNLSAAA
jgi:hypothetical protein